MPLFFKCCSNDFSYVKENSEYGTILLEKRTEKSTELYLDLGEKALRVWGVFEVSMVKL